MITRIHHLKRVISPNRDPFPIYAKITMSMLVPAIPRKKLSFWHFATNSNFLIPTSWKPDGVNL